MKFLIVLALLVSGNTFAAQRLSSKALEYLPVFSYDSTHSVAYTGAQGSVKMNAANGEETLLIRVLTTSAAYIDIGPNALPGSSKIPLPANTESIIEIVAGHYVGAAQQASAGTLYITRLKPLKD